MLKGLEDRQQPHRHARTYFWVLDLATFLNIFYLMLCDDEIHGDAERIHTHSLAVFWHSLCTRPALLFIFFMYGLSTFPPPSPLEPPLSSFYPYSSMSTLTSTSTSTSTSTQQHPLHPTVFTAANKLHQCQCRALWSSGFGFWKWIKGGNIGIVKDR